MTFMTVIRRCLEPLGLRQRVRRTRRSSGMSVSAELLEYRVLLSLSSTSPGFVTPQLTRFAPAGTVTPAVSASPSGVTPAQIRQAYGINNIFFGNGTIPGDGAGTTIAIVDAYDHPYIESDLHQFSLQFGLPDAVFKKVNQTGGTVYPATNSLWATEIALDVQWAHAIAPKANILLVEANSNSVSDLFAAVDYARKAPNVVAVSMSWGTPDFSSETQLDSYFTTPAGHNGVTFLASSGDSGSPISYPAISPNVVAVGGTTLKIDTLGNRISETAWSGSGSGSSAYETQPSWQSAVVQLSSAQGAVGSTKRAGPDVAYNSDPATGFPVYDSFNNPISAPWGRWGGTSAAAPQWAALVAIADQGRMLVGQGTLDGPTQTLPILYGMSATNFQDIITGTSKGTPTYSADVGFDFVTGRGSPNAPAVVADLVSGLGTKKLEFRQHPATFGTAGKALASTVQVAVLDTNGNVIVTDNSFVTLSLSSGTFANGNSTLTAQAVNGIASFSGITINTAGKYQLWASVGNAQGTPSVLFTIQPASPTQVGFLSTPTSVTAGANFGSTIKVAVQDAYGNVVTSANTTVTLGMASGPGSFASGSVLSATTTGGIATFSTLSLTVAGSYTFSAAANGYTAGLSNAVTIAAATATRLSVQQAPTTAAAGTAITPAVLVAIQDVYGNVANSSAAVTVSLSSGTFSSGKSTAVISAKAGIATFSSLIINTPGSYVLNFTSGTLTGTSTNLAITVGPAAKLVYLSQVPATVTAGTVITPMISVAITDKVGNVVTTDNSAVTLSLNTGTFANGSKAMTVQAIGGVASFPGNSNLIVIKTGTYRFAASSGTLTSATSSSFSVVAAAAAKLIFQTTPSTGTAGVVLATVAKVAIQDVYGNVVTSNTSTVSLSIATGPGPFVATSTLSVAAVNGVASFSNLTLNTSGRYTFRAVDGLLTAATSMTVTINPAAATKLVLLQAPTTAVAGTAFTPAVKIAVQDVYGNLASGSSVVTLSLSTGTFSTGLVTATATVSNGVATFSSLILNGAGNYTLTARNGLLTPTSFNVSVTPAVASKLVFLQQPTSGTVNVGLTTPVVIAVVDRFGNLVTTDNSTVTLTLSIGTFANGLKSTSVRVVNGIATFAAGTLIFNLAGTYQLIATDGSLTKATSTGIVVT
ncbi:MAG: hypothetical protein JSS02_21700 [Planctomycetes bacterium]|nr:hypothetical protein [Planctomycetota bacterium]